MRGFGRVGLVINLAMIIERLLEGFKLIKYDPKIEEVEIPGFKTKQKRDMSVLTLQRGDKEIPLKLGEENPYSEYAADLFFALDKTSYPAVKVDSELDLKGKKYRVIRIDTKQESVVIERLLDNEQFTIRKVSP